MISLSHQPGLISYLLTHLLPEATKPGQLILRQPGKAADLNRHPLSVQVIHLHSGIMMNPEVMTGQVTHHLKGAMILPEATTDQAIHHHKGVMILPEVVTGQVILLLPEVVHLPEVAAVAGLQEVVAVQAIILLPREEEGNNKSNNISLIIRLQNGNRHSAAL